jgi:hypothetical protein
MKNLKGKVELDLATYNEMMLKINGIENGKFLTIEKGYEDKPSLKISPEFFRDIIVDLFKGSEWENEYKIAENIYSETIYGVFKRKED